MGAILGWKVNGACTMGLARLRRGSGPLLTEVCSISRKISAQRCPKFPAKQIVTLRTLSGPYHGNWQTVKKTDPETKMQPFWCERSLLRAAHQRAACLKAQPAGLWKCQFKKNFLKEKQIINVLDL